MSSLELVGDRMLELHYLDTIPRFSMIRHVR